MSRSQRASRDGARRDMGVSFAQLEELEQEHAARAAVFGGPRPDGRCTRSLTTPTVGSGERRTRRARACVAAAANEHPAAAPGAHALHDEHAAQVVCVLVCLIFKLRIIFLRNGKYAHHS